ncbi:MAG: alpha/beta fold hydrolase [Candidatus Dormibacteria bacterium]
MAAHRSAGLNGDPGGDRATVAGSAGEIPRAALEERGSGDPLLLLHGWGASSELFAPILDALETGRRLIVPDLPGFGATPDPDAPWSVHDYAAWCVALLDRFGVEACDLIGHSNGGRIGIVLAATYPGRVRRMVLAGSAGIRPRRTWRGAARVRSYKALRAVERSAAMPAVLRRAAGRSADQRGSVDYRAVSGVMRGTLVRIVNEDLRGLLPGLHLPVLLIWGDRDTETPLDDGRLMERLIPDAGLVVFEGAGHYAYLEQAGRFCRIVEVFLRDPAPEVTV